ncbi:hypothetical protein [Qipengyuania sp. JC766]|uniref:hypothetical protein n=1 Tax=Qipengyuania sp. JC766 TaxID=3232139 RepID=UPI003459897F
MKLPDFVTFASEATIMALWGGGFLLLAALALLAERFQRKRTRFDRVGMINWTPIFLACAVVGGGLLAMAVPAMLRG